MRLFIRFIIICALGYLIYHFFGPQIDTWAEKAKQTILTAVKPENQSGSGEQSNRTHYPINKRTQ